MIRIITLLLLKSFLFFLSIESQAFQSIPDLKEQIKMLSSDRFSGRSYQDSGKFKAALYLDSLIQTTTTSNSLIRVKHTFDATINHIESVEFKINQINQKLTIDYAISGTTPSINVVNQAIQSINSTKSFSNIKPLSILYINSQSKDTTFLNLLKNELDLVKRLAQFRPKAILLNRPLPIYSPSTVQYPFTIVYVNKQLELTDSISIVIKSQLKSYSGENLIYKTDSVPKPRITIMAHYDHLGAIKTGLNHLEKLVYNGANDNASGVIAAIQIFNSLNREKKPVQLILTDAEELGLIGSYHLSNSTVLDSIAFLINLDMVASASNGIGVVGALNFPNEFNMLDSLVKPLDWSIKSRSNAPNSDHYWFLEKGIHGFYIYGQNGKQPYHSINDTVETLGFTFMQSLIEVLHKFLLNL